MKRLAGVILIALLAVGSFAGCGQSQQQAEEIKKRDTQIAQLQSQLSKLDSENKQLKTAQSQANMKVTLYFIRSLPTKLVLVPEERTIAPATGSQLMETALKELIAGPKTEGVTPVLPKDAKVLSVKVEKGIAIVNLSREATRLNVGSSGEALVVSAIANTITRLGTVDRVQIQVDGKIVETLAGHVSIKSPVRRNDTVVVH